ncbi:hypothetical protein DB31_0799 [Hyalangium minutum]|uniref:Uncharacterized protein n=1 Tax=Hyalangium minutum TaxID=394096 RepID=A0A085WF63_9BACT|nr:hypothetical protein DB31_0799 [Hyalangium minutum]
MVTAKSAANTCFMNFSLEGVGRNPGLLGKEPDFSPLLGPSPTP